MERDVVLYYRLVMHAEDVVSMECYTYVHIAMQNAGLWYWYIIGIMCT